MKQKLLYQLLPVVMLATAAQCYAAKGDTIFTESFDTAESLDAWTILDLNGGRSWEYLNGTAAYMLDWQTGLPGDDWLISPEFDLDAANVYDLRLYAGSLTRTESLRICLGTGLTPDDMTIVLADYPEFTSAMNGDRTLRIIVPKSGKYRLGFYAYSAPDLHRVEIDNISVTDAGSCDAPDKVTDAAILRGEKGAMTAQISFKAPTLTAALESLDSNMDHVSIYRNDEADPIVTFNDVEPGKAIEWTDATVPVNGFNTYIIKAANAAGESDPVELTDFIGHDRPLAVNSLLARVNDDKSVTVSWNVPSGSVDRGYVDFAALTYKVVRNDGTVVDEAMSATSFNDPRPVLEGQGTVSYTVTAVSAEGRESDSAVTNEVTTGTPLQLPYRESFADMTATVAWTPDAETYDFDWEMTFDDEWGEVEEIVSYDHDNGMLTAQSRYAGYGEESRLVSPMLDLSTVANPCLTFYFHYARSPWYDPEWDGEVNDRLEVQISRNGGEWKTLENAIFYINESNDGWKKCEVFLPKNLPGEFVNIGLLAVAEADMSAYRNIYVDNIVVDEAPCAVDLSLDGFSVDVKRASIGQKVTFAATVFNRGGQDAADFSVKFMRNGEVVATVPGSAITPASKKEFTMEYLPTLDDTAEESIEFSAIIEFATDENAGNNTSETVMFSVRGNDVAPVLRLDGENTGSEVILSWEPVQSVAAPVPGTPVTVTDDFESYEPFIVDNIGDWSTVDCDGATTLITPRIPIDYPHQGEPMAWQIFNVVDADVWTDESQDNAFRPYSGDQYIICMSTDYPAENDDWLITPRLDGRSHEVSFYAKAASYESEWMNVYYSTTDRHPDSFVKLNDGDRIYVPDGWTKYSFTIPDGARYFAVRCIRRTVLLMVDDFTYNVHDGQPDAATLVGYNIYRNGVKVNESPVTEPTFTDESASTGDKYRVTALYEEGESAYSPEFMADISGVANIAETAIRISGGNGEIVIETATSVDYTVYTTDGRTFVTGTAPDRIPATPGIYIVRAASTIAKIIVK